MRVAVILVVILVSASLPAAAVDSPAVLSLTAPAAVSPGSLLHATGKLSLSGQGLVLQEIEIFLDGVLVTTTTTNIFGDHEFDITVPGARGVIAIQTAWNRGGDLEERSPTRLIRLAELATPPTSVAANASAGRAPVLVSWGPPVDDGGAPVIGYRLERKVGAGAWTLITAGTAGARNATDASAPPSEWPSYHVIVRTARGNTTSDEVVVPLAPGAPRSARAISNTSIQGADITWLAPSGSVAPSGYRVWRDGVLLATTGATTFRISDPSLTPAVQYSYTVTATSPEGEGPPSAAALFASPPGAVTGFAATPVFLERTMHLSWDVPPVSSGVSRFRIERGGGSSWVLVGQPLGNATSYDARDLAYGTTYTFRISASNTGGYGAYAYATGRTDDGPYTFQHSTASAIVCPPPTGATYSGAPDGCGYAETGFVWGMGSSPPGGQNVTLSAWSNLYVKDANGFHMAGVTFDAWATTWIQGPCPSDGSACTASPSLRFDRNFTFTTPDNYQVIFAPGFDTFLLPLNECWDAQFRLRLTHPRALPNPTDDVALIRLCGPGA
jgi:hypothetical protein